MPVDQSPDVRRPRFTRRLLGRVRLPRLGRVRWGRLARRAVRLSFAMVLLGLILTGVSVAWVRAGTDPYIYSERDVPEAPVALVLGAQVYDNGVPSPFLTARLAI